MEEEKYERPVVQVYEAELRNGILDVTGGTDIPDIPNPPEDGD